MRKGRKQAVCCKCGKTLKGTVPIDAEEVTCFFCDNPPEDDDDDDNLILKSTIVRMK